MAFGSITTNLGQLGVVQTRRPSNPMVLGEFGRGHKSYGVMPSSFAPRKGYGTTPALTGLFRQGRLTVGISQINAMATWFNRGSGG